MIRVQLLLKITISISIKFQNIKLFFKIFYSDQITKISIYSSSNIKKQLTLCQIFIKSQLSIQTYYNQIKSMRSSGLQESKFMVSPHVLGYSRFGTVYLAHNQTNMEFAVKRYRKCDMTNQLFEILKLQGQIIKSIRDPNVVRIIKVVHKFNQFYIIMDRCDTSIDKAFQINPPRQEYCLIIFKKMFRSYMSLIRNKIIHRNLAQSAFLMKGQNFLIADFEGAYDYKKKNKVFAYPCSHASPQILQNKAYTTKTDIWSLGVTFFWICSGSLPWGGYDNKYISRCRQLPQYPKQINGDLKKIINSCLHYQQNSRICAKQLFNSLFGNVNKIRNQDIKKEYRQTFEDPSYKQFINHKVVDCCLQKALLDPYLETGNLLDCLILLGKDDIINVFNVWKKGNQKQEMTPQEFHSFINLFKKDVYDENKVNHLIQLIDKDNNGDISLEQIIQSMNDRINWNQYRKSEAKQIMFGKLHYQLLKAQKGLRTYFSNFLRYDQETMSIDKFKIMIDSLKNAQIIDSQSVALNQQQILQLYGIIKGKHEQITFADFRKYYILVNKLPDNYEENPSPIMLSYSPSKSSQNFDKITQYDYL